MSHRALLAAGLLAVMGVAATLPVSAPVSAQTAPSCDWYAKTGQKQQQDNEKMQCNLKGSEWSSDLKVHMTWCQSVPPDAWKAMAQKRDQALAECVRAKKK